MDTPTLSLLGAALMILGATIGGLILALRMRGSLARLEAARAVAEAKLTSAESAASKLGETFQALADAALRSSQGAFLETAKGTLETVRAEIAGDLAQRHTAVEGLVQPLATTLEKLDNQMRELEKARQESLGALGEQLRSLAEETRSLSTALRNPQARGRWGEVTLRRVAELAGMVKHCDFVEQETRESGDGRIRPDMVVRLPGGRTLVVDAKAPLTAYMEAVSAPDDFKRREALIRHGKQVAAHVDQLSGKQYWSQFQPAPEMVILFIPGDQFFSAALEYNPTLIEYALERKVLLATPTTLISILKGISYGWRQQQLAENAERIREVAAEFYDRVQVLHGHFEDTGRHLEKSVEAYNRSVASWESRLLPSLRKVRELGAVAGSEPEAPGRIDTVPGGPKQIAEG
jgi:DNA recombination protein RmuC